MYALSFAGAYGSLSYAEENAQTYVVQTYTGAYVPANARENACHIDAVAYDGAYNSDNVCLENAGIYVLAFPLTADLWSVLPTLLGTLQ